MKPSTFKTHNTAIVLIGIGLLVIGLLALWQRVWIADWLRVVQYTPPTEIVAITDAVKFTDTGRFYFYASEPKLDGTQNFTNRCGKHERSTNIVGCYVDGKIFLYDVDNEELDGIEEVTAAHEMLHAAYDRLSDRQRQTVDRLVQDEMHRHLSDKDFVARMKVYEDLPREDQIQEYHSVFATEVRNISDDLERHYDRYFQDRLSIVAMYERYSSVFRDLLDEAAALASSLDQQAARINQLVASYNQASTVLKVDIERFNRRAAQGDFDNLEDFRYERQIITNRSNQLDSQYDRINRLINQYNSDKQQYDGLAEHLTTLNNSLDSSLAPAPAVD